MFENVKTSKLAKERVRREEVVDKKRYRVRAGGLVIRCGEVSAQNIITTVGMTAMK